MEEQKFIPTEFERRVLELLEAGIRKTLQANLEQYRLLDDAEVAKMLGLSKGTLAVWRVNCKGPKYVKIGSNVRYRMADIVAFIEARTQRP